MFALANGSSGPEILPGLNTPALEGEAVISPDGQCLFFQSDRPNSSVDPTTEQPGPDMYKVRILAGP